VRRRCRSGSIIGVAATAAVALLPAVAAADPRPATVFINYDGGHLSGGDDSALDQLSCINGGFDHPAFFGSRALADQVTEQVRAILAPFAVRVVDERPPEHLPYTMVMMGGLPQSLGFPAGVGGYACVIDCGDALSRETVLVFAETIREPRELAQTVVHEVAHSWGLDHVLASELIMNPTTSGAERMLGDGCTALDEPADADCLEQHAMFCDAPSMQDSVAELLAVRGPSEPDLAPPIVEIVSPRAGARVVPGELVRVEVVVDDDRPEFGWRLVVPELAWAARGSEAALELRFPPGEHTVRVEAIDQAGNEATAEVRLMVGEGAGDDEPADVGGESEPSEPEPDGQAAEDDEASAGCRIAPGSSSYAIVALLLLALVRRRA
jgi:hypothetical protein